MACRLNTKAAFAWPAQLSRILDVDAAFRYLTCLAAVRYCEMRYCGVDWIAKVVNGDKTVVPYESPINLQNAHAANILGAAFLWDGGTQALVYYAFGVLVSATPGNTVFQDGPARTEVPVVTTPETHDEDLADAGAPLYMIGSKYPFRFWWQACNRAVWELVHEFPKYGAYDGGGNAYQVLPLCLAKLPSGADVKGPDDLLVPWTSLTGASSVVKVNAGERWLLSPADIDFGTDFLGFAQPTNTNALRNAWRSRAAAAGFDNLVPAEDQDSFIRPVFSQSAGRWWHGETGPEIDELNGRLKQLTGAWSGASSVWADEFPYHGYAALLAVLDYLESSNVGFAIACAAWDVLPTIYHTNYTALRTDYVDIPFTPGSQSQTVRCSGGWDSDTQESTSETERTPYAFKDVSVSPIAASYARVNGTVYWIVENLTRERSDVWSCDGDSAFDLLSRYVEGGATALKNELNARWQANITGGVVHFAFSSSYSEIMPSNSWYLQQPLADTDNAGLPFLGSSRKCVAESYWFLRTSHRARIASHTQLADVDLADVVRGDLPANLPSEPPPPGALPVDATVDATPATPFDVIETTDFLKIPSDATEMGYIVVQLPRINFQGTQIFPPALDVGDTTTFEMSDFSADVSVSSTDPNDYSSVTGTSESRFVSVNGLHFVHYPRAAIYPL